VKASEKKMLDLIDNFDPLETMNENDYPELDVDDFFVYNDSKLEEPLPQNEEIEVVSNGEQGNDLWNMMNVPVVDFQNIALPQMDGMNFNVATPYLGNGEDVMKSVNKKRSRVEDDLIDEEVDRKEIIRPKKRVKTTLVKLPNPETIESLKDTLVSLNSVDFEDFIQKFTENKKRLSKEERDVIKDLRRKVKNRESARKSRINKKNKVDILEKKIEILQENTDNMKEYVSVLKNENNNIKSEISYLYNLIQSNPMMKNLFAVYSMNPESFIQTMNTQSSYLISCGMEYQQTNNHEYLQTNEEVSFV